jgi:hypothetical protein
MKDEGGRMKGAVEFVKMCGHRTWCNVLANDCGDGCTCGYEAALEVLLEVERSAGMKDEGG